MAYKYGCGMSTVQTYDHLFGGCNQRLNEAFFLIFFSCCLLQSTLYTITNVQSTFDHCVYRAHCAHSAHRFNGIMHFNQLNAALSLTSVKLSAYV